MHSEFIISVANVHKFYAKSLINSIIDKSSIDKFYAKSLFIVLFKNFVVIKIFNLTCTQPDDVIYHKKLRFLDKFYNF